MADPLVTLGSTALAIDARDGGVVIPSSPAAAKARLAQLEADPKVVAALMDPLSADHKLRLDERKALQIASAGGPGSKPLTEEQETNRARARMFGRMVEAGAVEARAKNTKV
ncbi:MAG: hypothetical protein Q8P46_16340 [Hyphomicrobiales bacterium]|nr:hypothetical protein [Hyphomicrobiales bacterium]